MEGRFGADPRAAWLLTELLLCLHRDTPPHRLAALAVLLSGIAGPVQIRQRLGALLPLPPGLGFAFRPSFPIVTVHLPFAGPGGPWRLGSQRSRADDIPGREGGMTGAASQWPGRAVGQVTPDTTAGLMPCGSPGNVREVRSLLEPAHVLGTSREIRAAELPALSRSAKTILPAEELPTLPQIERGLVRWAHRPCRRSTEKGARVLKTSAG